MTRLRFAVPLALFAVLAVFLGIGMTRDPHEVPSPLVGRPAPGFELTRLEAPARTLRRDDLLGRVWVLNVWASWCEACRAEHPLLLELARGSAVPVVGLDYKDARADAVDWLRRFGDPYQATLFDGDGRVGIDYGVYGVPETFIVDRTGAIRYKLAGPITRETLDTKIRPLLKALDG